MSTRKCKFVGLSLEMTRMCNLRCVHCMCGEPQNVTITKAIIDKVLSQITEIDELLLGGGEPLLALDEMEYLVDAISKHRVKVYAIQLVTNGSITDDRVVKIFQRFLAENPDSNVDFGISNDVFHDATQSKKCLEFYKKSLGDRCNVIYHKEINFLHASGRADGKKECKGIPVSGISENALRTHRIKIEDGDTVCCLMAISANGNLGLHSDVSFEKADELAIGNVLDHPLLEIIKEHNKKCVCACDECYNEVCARNLSDFGGAAKNTAEEFERLKRKIRIRRLELIWGLRQWAVEKTPDVDVRDIIQGTMIEDENFVEYIEWSMKKQLLEMDNTDERLKELLRNADFLSRFVEENARSLFSKEYRERFPWSSKEDTCALSVLRTVWEFASSMTVDGFKEAMFKGNPAEEYFQTIGQRLSSHGIFLKDFDECAKIPDSYDDRDVTNDDEEANEFQSNSDG